MWVGSGRGGRQAHPAAPLPTGDLSDKVGYVLSTKMPVVSGKYDDAASNTARYF